MKSLMLIQPFYYVILFLLFSCNNQEQSLKTENIVYSNPIDNLSIDGNIDDWPSNTIHYPINKTLWEGQKGTKEDFSAYFLSGYNLKENALYLAIVVDDDTLSFDKENPDIHHQDAYLLYINEKNSRRGSGIARYAIAENHQELLDTSDNWDSELKNLLNWNKIEYKIGSTGKQRVYELKFTLNEPIYNGRIIGLGHIVHDRDIEEQTSYGWIDSGDKDSSAQPDRIGMLVFLNDNKTLGNIEGNVTWKDSTIITKPEGVNIISKNDTNFWMHLPVDSNGNFSTILPAGQYIMKPGKIAFFSGNTFYRADTLTTKPFEVKANDLQNKVTYFLQPEKQQNFKQKGNLLYNLKENGKQKIDETIKSYMQFYGIEGVSFAALKKGEIIYHETYGVKNNYTKEKVTKNTLFEVASITKPVFSFAVLRLYEKGLIDLDKPLYEYLTFEAISENPYSKLITARIVLSHQTGFPNWAENGKLEFMFKPGTAFGYSGEGYEYLKRVIEKITNKEINQVLNEEVVKPLGLEHMYFMKNDYASKNKSHGHYNSYPGKIDLTDKPWVAGCLVTNAISFSKFMTALQSRKGLKPETFNMMLSSQINIPENYRENNWGFDEYMGLGIFVEKTPYGNVFRHSGNNGDFKAMFRLYDDFDMAYIIMTNGNTGHFLINNIEKILVDPKELSKVKH